MTTIPEKKSIQTRQPNSSEVWAYVRGMVTDSEYARIKMEVTRNITTGLQTLTVTIQLPNQEPSSTSIIIGRVA